MGHLLLAGDGEPLGQGVFEAAELEGAQLAVEIGALDAEHPRRLFIRQIFDPDQQQQRLLFFRQPAECRQRIARFKPAVL